jgi:rare lipoprotein A
LTPRTPHATLVCALALSAALALPAAAAATDTASGGTGGTAATGGIVAPGDGEGTLAAGSGALVGRSLHLRGAVPARQAGRTVLIQRRGGSGWSTVASAQPDRDGNFSARWRPRTSGHFTLRAVVDGTAVRADSSTPSSGAVAHVTVYPSAVATWYGPGSSRFASTACGVRLTKTTLGVAHRTLPCGTRVELYYRGRSIVVPVIDRGPYANGADWDLTIATSDALGFTDVGLDRIGALPAR